MVLGGRCSASASMKKLLQAQSSKKNPNTALIFIIFNLSHFDSWYNSGTCLDLYRPFLVREKLYDVCSHHTNTESCSGKPYILNFSVLPCLTFITNNEC